MDLRRAGMDAFDEAVGRTERMTSDGSRLPGPPPGRHVTH
jgi:hypothetical protein